HRGYAVRSAIYRNPFENFVLARQLLQRGENIPEADRLFAMNRAIVRDYRGVAGFCRTDAHRGYVLLTAIGEGKLSLARQLLLDGNHIPETDRIAAIRKMVRRDPRDLVYLQDLLILTRRHRLIAACASDKIQMAIIAMIALMVAAIAPYIGQEKS
ncbi:MAG TPA: hypothetical protein VLE89_04885, partial [Chlamydiales bacterium]|nr:hypothetical protein [Chlamydiales bacterium]